VEKGVGEDEKERKIKGERAREKEGKVN